MHIISKKKLREYLEDNAQAELPLAEWFLKMKNFEGDNINQLRKLFNSVDYAHGYTIFNIGGNNYRLITAIHYNRQRCYIRSIWTHAEYSKPTKQQKLSRGEL